MSDKIEAMIDELLELHGDVTRDVQAVGYSDAAPKRNAAIVALCAAIASIEAERDALRARVAELEAAQA